MREPRVIFSNIMCMVVVCFVLTACQKPTTYTPELSDLEIAVEQEKQQRMVDEVAAQGGKPKAWRNPKNMRKTFEMVAERIETAGADICRAMKLQKNGCYYYFKLSRDEDINASADGKNIVINTGMMRFIENDDELATIMAHEFAHNLMGHINAQKNNATVGKLLGLAVDAIADTQGVNMQGEMTKAGSEIALLAYSADFEKEADYVGLYVMAKAGYDIHAAANLWRRMSIEDPEGIYHSITHPSNSERSVALRKTVYEIETKRKNRLPLVPDFRSESQP